MRPGSNYNPYMVFGTELVNLCTNDNANDVSPKVGTDLSILRYSMMEGGWLLKESHQVDSMLVENILGIRWGAVTGGEGEGGVRVRDWLEISMEMPLEVSKKLRDHPTIDVMSEKWDIWVHCYLYRGSVSKFIGLVNHSKHSWSKIIPSVNIFDF